MILATYFLISLDSPKKTMQGIYRRDLCTLDKGSANGEPGRGCKLEVSIVGSAESPVE